MIDKRYQTLIILAKTLSYTRTAQELFITQPAVSQQIDSLERDLALKLVDKAHRKITLTPAGHELATFAQQMEFEGNKLIESLQEDRKEQIKIGCTLSLSATILPNLVSLLSDQSHNITTKINNTEKILQDIRTGGVDFGLIEGNYNKREFDSVFLKNEEFICVAQKNFPINSTNSLAGLLDRTLLLREEGSGTREIFENWLSTQNYQVTDFHKIIEIASPAVIISLLKANAGISFIYKSLVQTELASGELKEVAINGLKIEHPINLVFLKNSYFKETYQTIAEQII